MRRRGKQPERRLLRKGSLGFANRPGVITLLVSGAPQLIEAPGVLVAWRTIDDGAQELPDCLVLTRAAHRAVAMSGEHGLPDVVAGVVGEVVPVLRLGEVGRSAMTSLACRMKVSALD